MHVFRYTTLSEFTDVLLEWMRAANPTDAFVPSYDYNTTSQNFLVTLELHVGC